MANNKIRDNATPPDPALINELYDAMERHPPAIDARKLLIEHYVLVGWTDAAVDATTELLRLAPQDEMAKSYAIALSGNVPLPQTKVPTSQTAYKPLSRAKIDDLQLARQEFTAGWETLRERAQELQQELRLATNLPLEQEYALIYKEFSKQLSAFVDGKVNVEQRVRPPSSVKVARKMEKNRHQALDIAISDLNNMAGWMHSDGSQESPLDKDGVREVLAKRVAALVAALPADLQDQAVAALMHVEHEFLRREYVCKETMLGDPITDIPRANFWVSEDGYAWDMAELAQAIKSQDGVMRNPLSKQMFTPNDVRVIIRHPLGDELGALQVEQRTLSKGVRPATVKRLADLAQVLSADMSPDQMASRHALDEFLAYVATLPETEQRAIDKLRVPAKDSHSGLPFDSTIGEAVRDAQGNRVCIHKIGDFLGQAAHHLG